MKTRFFVSYFLVKDRGTLGHKICLCLFSEHIYLLRKYNFLKFNGKKMFFKTSNLLYTAKYKKI